MANIRWAEEVTHAERLVEIRQGTRTLERPKHRREETIGTNVKTNTRIMEIY